MSRIVDFDSARERLRHERKEARVKGIRNAFKVAREAADPEFTPVAGLKALFSRKKKNKDRKKQE
ncbi:MAG: hypothetical protein RQ899_06630 [Pseudomonadales bacterium]|nr:hypothetical protein [Pseudomonadales bacterium]